MDPAANPYTLLIDAARETIVHRARLYKRLVIAVALGSLLLIGLAVALRSPLPLLAWASLPPLVLLHRAQDLRAVHRWRQQALDHWAGGRLQLELLARTLRLVPALPASTVEGMLESLPAWSAPAPAAGRGALAIAQGRLGAAAEAALRIRAVAWVLALLAVLLAWQTSGLAWLALLLPATALPRAWSAWMRHRLARLLAAVLDECGASEGPAAVAQLNWLGVPAPQWHAGSSRPA